MVSQTATDWCAPWLLPFDGPGIAPRRNFILGRRARHALTAVKRAYDGELRLRAQAVSSPQDTGSGLRARALNTNIATMPAAIMSRHSSWPVVKLNGVKLITGLSRGTKVRG